MSGCCRRDDMWRARRFPPGTTLSDTCGARSRSLAPSRRRRGHRCWRRQPPHRRFRQTLQRAPRASCRSSRCRGCSNRACSEHFSTASRRGRMPPPRRIQQLLVQARPTGTRELLVPDAIKPQAPAAAAFLRGLSLLAATETRRGGKRVPRCAPRVARLLPGDGLPRRVLRRGQKGSRSGRRMANGPDPAGRLRRCARTARGSAAATGPW